MNEKRRLPTYVILSLVLLLIFVTVGLLMRDFKMAVVPFHDWDESIYADVALEMSRNWSLATTFNYHLWLAKPPLVMILMAIGFLFTKSEVLARSYELVTSVGLVAVIFFLSRQIYSESFKDRFNRLSGLEKTMVYVLPAITLLTSGFFIDRATLVSMDAMLALSWAGYFLFRKNYWAKLFFLLLGTLTKSLLGLFPLLLELVFLNVKLLNPKTALKYFGLLVLGLSWHIYSYIKYGFFFIQAHILDELVSRITTPIEFHFGGKYYYSQYLYQDLVTRSPINIILPLMVVAYVILAVWLVMRWYQKKATLKEILTDWNFWILGAPILYFVFLNLGKAKLYWYLYSLIPLACLILPVILLAIPEKISRSFFFIVITISMLIKFVPETYALQLNYTVPDKTQLGKCLSTKNTGKILFLVPKTERDSRHTMEAANLQIGATFVYGGAPNFVYYADKPVDFNYKIEEFSGKVSSYKTVVVSQDDLNNSEDIRKQMAGFNIVCKTETWIGFMK